MQVVNRRSRVGQNGAAVSAQAHITWRCEGPKAHAEAKKELKKRHVQSETRLPTKRMATACWAFIVVKSPPLQAAYLLGLRPLRGANSKIYPQLINIVARTPWHHFRLAPARQSSD
jgi:hypothetical protein